MPVPQQPQPSASVVAEEASTAPTLCLPRLYGAAAAPGGDCAVWFGASSGVLDLSGLQQGRHAPNLGVARQPPYSRRRCDAATSTSAGRRAGDRRWLSGADDRHTPRLRRGGGTQAWTSASVTLPQQLTAPRSARQFTAAACDAAGLIGDVRDSALLVVSEVVTNAVVHGLSAPRLTVWTTQTSVRVEVGDTSSSLPVQADVADDAGSGRGLPIMESCASVWGWRLKRQGKVVWFIVRSGGDLRVSGGDRRVAWTCRLVRSFQSELIG